MIGYRWRAAWYRQFSWASKLARAGDDSVRAIHESPLQDRSHGLILMGDRCGRQVDRFKAFLLARSSLRLFQRYAEIRSWRLDRDTLLLGIASLGRAVGAITAYVLLQPTADSGALSPRGAFFISRSGSAYFLSKGMSKERLLTGWTKLFSISSSSTTSLYSAQTLITQQNVRVIVHQRPGVKPASPYCCHDVTQIISQYQNDITDLWMRGLGSVARCTTSLVGTHVTDLH